MLNTIRSLWREEVLSYRFGREIALSIAVAGLAFGAYKGYQWHRYKTEQAAQYALSEAIDELDKSMFYLLDSKDRNIELAQQFFADAQLVFDTMHSSYARSGLIPFAYGFEADIAIHQKDVEKALSLLDKAVASCSSGDVLRSLFVIKRALIALDFDKDVEANLALLEKMAFDPKEKNYDSAAFYLGYYYLTHDRKNDAIRVWSMLRESMMKVTSYKTARSPWLFIVIEKLDQLGA